MHHPTADRASWRPWAIVLAFGAAFLVAVLVAAPAGAATRATYIVQLAKGTTLEQGANSVRAAGGTVTGELPIINGLAVRTDARGAQALSDTPGVAVVTANASVKPQAYSLSDLQTAYPASVSADKPWTNGFDGKGVGVAVIDTGIAGDMPDFKGADGTSRVIASAVTNPGAVTSGDAYGHGTHVAGIIAGDGTRRSGLDPLRGQYVGIAPEANLISVKASDELGNATVLDVINGLQFVVDHKSDLNIRVVNLSLQSSTAQSYKTDPLDAAVESAWFNGIVVVAAAGNLGTASDAVQYAPGNDPYVISVGAVDDQGTKSTSDDVAADWSSVGQTQDGFAKPDLMAPGAHIVSTLSAGSAFTTLCPTCITGGAYIRAGGTSMAAPVVSGVIADVLQKRPDLTPDQVKTLLMSTGRPINYAVREVNASPALTASPGGNVNQGLTPNSLVDPSTGNIDYTRSSWSRSSWSQASNPLTAAFARSSWSCTCTSSSNSVDPSRSSWSRSSWSTKWSY